MAAKKIDISNDRAERKRMTDAKKRRQTSGQNVDAATRNPTIRAKQNQRLASMAQAGKSGASGKAAVKAAKDGAKDRAKKANPTPENNPHFAGYWWSNVGTKMAGRGGMGSPFTGGQQVEEARQAQGRRKGIGMSRMLPQLTQLEHFARHKGYKGNPIDEDAREYAKKRMEDYRRHQAFGGDAGQYQYRANFFQEYADGQMGRQLRERRQNAAELGRFAQIKKNSKKKGK
jgi:hypothetical protein